MKRKQMGIYYKAINPITKEYFEAPKPWFIKKGMELYETYCYHPFPYMFLQKSMEEYQQGKWVLVADYEDIYHEYVEKSDGISYYDITQEVFENTIFPDSIKDKIREMMKKSRLEEKDE